VGVALREGAQHGDCGQPGVQQYATQAAGKPIRFIELGSVKNGHFAKCFDVTKWRHLEIMRLVIMILFLELNKMTLSKKCYFSASVPDCHRAW